MKELMLLTVDAIRTIHTITSITSCEGADESDQLLELFLSKSSTAARAGTVTGVVVGVGVGVSIGVLRVVVKDWIVVDNNRRSSNTGDDWSTAGCRA